MNYDPLIRRNNDRRSRFPIGLKIILAIVLILVVFHFFAPKVISSAVTFLVKPLWSVELTDRENQELRQKLAQNEAMYAQTELLRQENEQLKSMLGRSASSTSKVMAQILKKPPISAYDIFVIDIGNDHGIKNGDKVYALGDIPIGEIAEVDTNTSKVKLYSSSGEKFDVLIGKENIQATAIGKGGGTFEVSLPHDTKIIKGDNVTIPSLNNSFVGVVEGVASDPSEPFSTILFHQPFNLYELRWVLVNRNI